MTLICSSFVGVMVVNFVLPLEFVTPSWRTFCGCVGFWAVGLMTLAIWGYLISEWRYLIIGTSVSGVFMLFSWWWVKIWSVFLKCHSVSRRREMSFKKIFKQTYIAENWIQWPFLQLFNTLRCPVKAQGLLVCSQVCSRESKMALKQRKIWWSRGYIENYCQIQQHYIARLIYTKKRIWGNFMKQTLK